MKQGKGKWRWIVLPAVLALAVAAVGIYQYVAPRLTLSSALPQLFKQLEKRFEGDPLLLLIDSYDPEGAYTADVVIKGKGEAMEPVTYDMNVQTDAAGHRVLADGTVSNSEKSVNLSIYLDSSFAAISSEELVSGNYFGITYDTFSSDIRNIPILSPFVSEQVLTQWENTVQGLKNVMQREYAGAALPSMPELEWDKLLLGIAALPCTVENVSASVNGETLHCKKLDYTIDNKQLRGILDKATGKAYSENTAVFASFYLYEQSIVRLLLQYQQGSVRCAYNVTFGTDPQNDLLTLQATENRGGEQNKYAFSLDTQRKETVLTQTWYCSDGQAAPAVYAYVWDPAAASMELHTDAASEPVRIALSGGDSGLQIGTADLGKLTRAITKDEKVPELLDGLPCSMTVRKGSRITTPEYKNVDAWSFDDFLVLMGGLGSLIGFPPVE